jgi:hypothetical protein
MQVEAALMHHKASSRAARRLVQGVQAVCGLQQEALLVNSSSAVQFTMCQKYPLPVGPGTQTSELQPTPKH